MNLRMPLLKALYSYISLSQGVFKVNFCCQCKGGQPKVIIVDGNTCAYNASSIDLVKPWVVNDTRDCPTDMYLRNVFTRSMGQIRILTN